MITELFKAVHRSETLFVAEYVKSGYPVNGFDAEGSSPLHEAVYCHDEGIFELLCNHGADPNCEDANGNTPLHLAAMCGDLKKVTILLDFGAQISSVSPKSPWTPLMLAINGRHCEVASYLIRKGADIHFVDSQEGWTPLLVACEQKLTDFAMLLIGKGADIHACIQSGDLSGHTALELISYYGDAQLVNVLLERGAEINHQPNGTGLSALHWSVYNGHVELMHLLVEAGANVNIPASGIYQNRTPLHYAVCGVNEKMTAYLLSKGADPYLKDQEGKNALILARNKKERFHQKENTHRILHLLEQYA